MKPPESDKVTGFAPNSISFSQANCATFPDPETVTVLPSNESSLVLSISATK